AKEHLALNVSLIPSFPYISFLNDYISFGEA
ncbi:unnamed protein product, partial [marine sediment metagenome]